MSSSVVVNLTLHAAADGPEDPDEHGQEPTGDYNVSWDGCPGIVVLILEGHQVGPDACQCKSHTRQDDTSQRPQLLLHIHDLWTDLLLFSCSFRALLFLLMCPLVARSSSASFVDTGIRQELFTAYCTFILLVPTQDKTFLDAHSVNKFPVQVWMPVNGAAADGMWACATFSVSADIKGGDWNVPASSVVY